MARWAVKANIITTVRHVVERGISFPISTSNQKQMIRFSDSKLEEVRRIIERYPEGRQKSAVIPLLHLAQEEFGGWLSPESMDYVGSLLQMEPIEVYEVATFYSMFHLEPVGKHVFEVCHTGPCMLRGSDDIITHIKSRLGIGVGQTTTDGLFTLKTVECLGACGYAPMMQLGKHYREHLTKDRVDGIIEECRAAAQGNS
jgi:NADH-quinone oxidoreductase subunit E